MNPTQQHQALVQALQYHQSGANAQAEPICRQVLAINPNNTDALCVLGVVCQSLGRVDEGISHFQQALRLKPYLVDVLNNLGHALRARGRLDEAVVTLQQALQIKPDFAHAHLNLGLVLKEKGRVAEAEAHYRTALQLNPNFFEAYNNLGNALHMQGRLDEALACHQQALRLRPDKAMAHYNLGNVYGEQGRLDEAVQSIEQALRLKPGYIEAYHGLGRAYAVRGKLKEAVECYQKAIQLKPDFVEGHLSLGMAWLTKGELEKGWPEYEWRWKSPDCVPASFYQPRWDGSSFAGRAVLLYGEQGLGDTLQFIRFAPLVKERGGTVLVDCPASLVRLLGSCRGIDALYAKGSPLPAFDFQSPLLSLASVFRTSEVTLPAEVPYLHPPEQEVEHWQRELAGVADFKVGIAWQGSPTHKRDRQRSFPVSHFAPLGQLEGVRLFSLQKGAGTEQLDNLSEFAVTDLGSKTSPDFVETAAIIKNLDLVICPDTALAHLAGALGARVWVALPYEPDWRWMRDRDDSPWYPTMRLFRQREIGDWPEVFQRMSLALTDLQSQLR